MAGEPVEIPTPVTPEVTAPPLPERDSREDVLAAFNSTFKLYEKEPSARFETLKQIKEKTIDVGKTSYRKSVKGVNGASFSQMEGVPVEDLITFLTKKIEFGDTPEPQKEEFKRLRSVLARNSRLYLDMPGNYRGSPIRVVDRVRQEYENIKSNPDLSSGDSTKDYIEAINRITIIRRELILPKAKTKAERAKPPITLPTEVAIEEAAAKEDVLPEDVRDVLKEAYGGGEEPVAPEPAPTSSETGDSSTPEPAPTEPEATEPPTPESAPPAEEPSGEYPEDYSEPLPLEEVRMELHIVNRTRDVEKRARDLAEVKLREKLRGGNILRRIKYRLGEEYYRQKFTEQIRAAMLANNNSYLTMEVGKGAAVQAEHDRGLEQQAGSAKIEQIKAGEKIVGEKIIEAEGPIKRALIEQIIQPALRGEIADVAQLRLRLTQFMTDHQVDPLIQEIFGQDTSIYGRMADYFASDILDLTQHQNNLLKDHKDSVEMLDQVINLKLANMEWAAETTRYVGKSETGLSRTDRFVKWAQKRRTTGLIFNPAVIGAASSIGTFLGFRAVGMGTRLATHLATPGAGMLTGGAFAAFRRNYDLKVDRAAHQVEMTYGGRIKEGSKRRERLEDFAYDTVSATELLSGIGDVRTIDLSQESNRHDLIGRIAEIRERLDYSAANKVDLITYSSAGEVEQGRLQLLKAVAEAKIALRAAGFSDTQIGLAQEALRPRFEQNQVEKDKAFKRYRIKESLKAGVFGGAAGLGAGLLAQEATVWTGRSGIFHHDLGRTSREVLLGNHRSPLDPEAVRGLYGPGGKIIINDHLTLNVLPDHTASLLNPQTGQALSQAHLVIGSNGHISVTGDLSKDLQDQMTKAGLGIRSTGEIVKDHVVYHSVKGPSKEIPMVHGEKAIHEWRKLGTKIDHREWYSYDRPRSQLNELRLYDSKHGDVVTLNMNHMKLGYQHGLNPNPIDVQETIRNHESGFYFSLPDHTQHGIWIPDGADGKWDGLLHLNPHDTTHLITMPDGSKMNLGDFSKMVVNQRLLSTLPDGDIATEVHPHLRNIFNLGHNGKLGFIEAGRLTRQHGGTTLQAFATIRGASPVQAGLGHSIPTTIRVPEHVQLRVPTYEIFPQPNPEVPLIPFPFYPRLPLEPLEKSLFLYGYGTEYARGQFGLLPWSEYKNRLSQTIKNNPGMKLDEKEEVRTYLETLDPEYKKEIEEIDAILSKPMSEKCRTIIMIPAYQEEQNIKKALEHFLNQKDDLGNAVNPESFEIVILDNHPETVAKDGTQDEVRTFLTEHPEMRVIYAHKSWGGEEAGVGRARKYIADLALLRSSKRSSQDGELILVSQDADIDGLSEKYISRIIKKFDSDSEIDALAGRWTLPEYAQEKPNLRAAQGLWYLFDRIIARDLGAPPGEREIRSPGLVGRNSSFRASAYSAIGGYNPKAKLAEDLEVGWMISEARGWDQRRIKSLGGAEVVSNPRRFLAAVAQRIPLIQMYGGFHENTEIRKLDNKAVLKLIPDEFDKTMFEGEADAIWQSGTHGQYQHLGEKFEPIFTRTMELMGVQYRIEDEHVKITNVDQLLENLKKPVNILSADKPPFSISEETTEAEATIQVPAPKEPENPEEKDLITKINKRLAENTGSTAGVEISQSDLLNYLKEIPLPQGARFEDLDLKIENGQIKVVGRIRAKGSASRFNLKIDSASGKLTVADQAINYSTLHRMTKGRIESSLTQIDILLKEAMNKQIDPKWEVDGFWIAINQLDISFKKKPEAPAGTETTIDEKVLRKVIDKCTKKYEDKYSTGLFGVNVDLSESEISEVQKLIERASLAHEGYTNGIKPQWDAFLKNQEERIAKGVVLLDNIIEEDPSATETREEMTDRGFTVLKVPSDVYKLYKWGNAIDATRETLRLYVAGVNKATMAKYFGEDINRLLSFK